MCTFFHLNSLFTCLFVCLFIYYYYFFFCLRKAIMTLKKENVDPWAAHNYPYWFSEGNVLRATGIMTFAKCWKLVIRLSVTLVCILYLPCRSKIKHRRQICRFLIPDTGEVLKAKMNITELPLKFGNL